MAYILIEVDNISEAGRKETEFKELEGIIFRDDNGKEKKFKLDGVITKSTQFMKEKFPDIDWDETNYHLAILVGSLIK